MNAVTMNTHSAGGWIRVVRRFVFVRALGPAPHPAVLPGGKMSSLDPVLPQPRRLLPLMHMPSLVAVGEDNSMSLQHMAQLLVPQIEGA